MVTIRQNGSSGELFDLNTFLEEVDEFAKVETWIISVEECIGDGADDIQAQSFPVPITMDSSKLSEIYRHIYQTIDGEFVGFIQRREWCRLVAIDSSYWEISGTLELETQLEKTYGRYEMDIAYQAQAGRWVFRSACDSTSNPLLPGGLGVKSLNSGFAYRFQNISIDYR